MAPGHVVDDKGVCGAAAVLGERKCHTLLGNVADNVACHQDNADEHQKQPEAADQLLVQQHVGAHLVHHLAHDGRRDDAPQSGCAHMHKKKRVSETAVHVKERGRIVKLTNPEPMVMTVPAVPDISTYSPMYAHSEAHRGPM